MSAEEKKKIITLGTLSYNRYGFLLRGYDLYNVSRRDIIRPDDHNNVKYFLKEWMKKTYWDLTHPDLFSAVDYLQERKYGDFVYPEDWNTVLDMLRKIDDTITADGWKPSTPSAELSREENFRAVYHLIVQSTLDEAVPAGGIASYDYNIRLRALRYLDYISAKVGGLKAPETEPEFSRLRLYDSTSRITVYCTKNQRTHYGKESGMPSNYVYTYWFEDSTDWDYNDAMVRIYWEFPNYRLDIGRGSAGDPHYWYYDNTLIVGPITEFVGGGVYKIYASVWVDGRTKNLVKYTVY